MVEQKQFVEGEEQKYIQAFMIPAVWRVAKSVAQHPELLPRLGSDHRSQFSDERHLAFNNNVGSTGPRTFRTDLSYRPVRKVNNDSIITA